MAIHVMMVDEDVNHMKEVKQYFSSSSSINILNIVNSKDEALKLLNSNYDVLVLNLLLSGLDSMMILAQIRELNLNKKVIVTSEFISPEMMKNLNDYKPDYFIKKPYSMSALEKVITNICSDETVSSKDMDLKVEITNMLHALGIPSHIKGYAYIRDGIEMLYKDSSLIGSITKELYPSIARTYATTSSRVERAIRHAIEVSWIRGDYNLMEELFGNSVDYDRSKPTNSEFIVTLADRLKLENNIV